MNSVSPPLKKTWRREKSGWSLAAMTASILRRESKSKKVGRRRDAAIRSTAADLASEEDGGRDLT